MIKLCVFDFDSTLMDGETIDILADAYGVGDKVKEITKKAMQGELDFFESLSKRVALLNGMPTSLVSEVCSNLKQMNGAKELVKGLKERGIKVIVFSGGFHIATDLMREEIGYDESFANILHEKDGVLTGLVGGEMMFGFSKGEMIKRMQKILGVSKDETMCVGDGANDASMFKHAGISVAFCAKEILKKSATHCVDTKDLREILRILD
ncbi:phosphoserine phosphatase SerB [Campylobacter sp. RM13119]|uniref:Phosphoserine phosphatase n=3 Tax=Campylobacter californiensis TaxID=1032243 RepID=A0AAW3ZV08_9BACT|nr:MULTISPECIES: phosphoserine phosphatase SerB [unclassified Campylobacter]MBE2984146.1 phosphoserine phosphatase SerB [Campylobacter sp. RM6883]MBE2986230.1 phosphoserine phosphatase SerB [Campylobacter sp. RM12919]MBE2988227.1 phosphoserine phosphatase SerB [Campylobacter sp. RM12920]MBE2995516.1 phosphoserine phosphatase SerB [Campylobacter sp. RM6913]MBE3022615.1 phosphoserine phosphatase SerB [Campylobacter sp. 7477a]